MLREHSEAIRGELAAVGVELPEDAWVFSNDPMGANPWNPDWTTHNASDLMARRYPPGKELWQIREDFSISLGKGANTVVD